MKSLTILLIILLLLTSCQLSPPEDKLSKESEEILSIWGIPLEKSELEKYNILGKWKYTKRIRGGLWEQEGEPFTDFELILENNKIIETVNGEINEFTEITYYLKVISIDQFDSDYALIKNNMYSGISWDIHKDFDFIDEIIQITVTNDKGSPLRLNCNMIYLNENDNIIVPAFYELTKIN